MLPVAPMPRPAPEAQYVGVLRHKLRAALDENRRLKRELFMVRQDLQTKLARMKKAAP
jgi:hypothetical protein